MCIVRLLSSLSLLVLSSLGWAQTPASVQSCRLRELARLERLSDTRAPYQPFQVGGEFAADYSARIAALKIGDRIQLPSGRVYAVHAILGEGRGQLTRIIDIGDGEALRLPQHAGDQSFTEATENQILGAAQDYVRVQRELKQAGVPVVEVDEARSEPPFGIVVKKHEFKFEGDQFISALEHPGRSQIPPAELARAREGYLKLLESTWAYNQIGDFTPRQMGWDGERWVIFDFSSVNMSHPMHQPLRNFKSKQMVASSLQLEDGGDRWEVRWIPKTLEAEAKARVLAVRKRMRKSGTWFLRPTDGTSRYQEFVDRVAPSPLPPRDGPSHSRVKTAGRLVFLAAPIPRGRALTSKS